MCFTHGHGGLEIVRERLDIAVSEQDVKLIGNVILKHARVAMALFPWSRSTVSAV